MQTGVGSGLLLYKYIKKTNDWCYLLPNEVLIIDSIMLYWINKDVNVFLLEQNSYNSSIKYGLYYKIQNKLTRKNE